MPLRSFLFFLLFITGLLLRNDAWGQKILQGKAVRIVDGDTFELLDEQRVRHKIRLYGIDAPEKGQAFGQVAKQALSGLIFNRDVQVIHKGKDRHGRMVGEVFCGKEQINVRLVLSGMAWHFTRYSSDQTYARAQRKAMAQRVGLWIQHKPQAPWEYRAERRAR